MVPLSIARGGARVNAKYVLLLEDLHVQPGDFVSYYVRAQEAGGRVTRSDIYFLEVKPFEQEFVQGSGQKGKGDGHALDDLVSAQKEMVAATWKIDRRVGNAKDARPEQDIRLLSAGESELKARVEQTSGTFRAPTLKDSRRAGAPLAGQALPEEAEMMAAATSMGQAVLFLNELKTGSALPHEMDALNHLLKAQAEARRRDVAKPQPVETLLDKDLQRGKRTNYENRSATEQQDEATHAALEKITNLARRQDELLKRQDALARDRESLAEATLKRELEKLTKEQSDLRQRLEDLELQMDGDGQLGDMARQLREASDDMRNAANDMRREDPAQASAKGRSALEMLRELEQSLQASRPGETRTAGELESAARQLGDRQRQVAAEVSKLAPTAADRQATQWLATEEEQLAARLRTLQERLKLASTPAPPVAKTKDKSALAAAGAALELDRQRLAERMQKSADALRTGRGPARRGPGRRRDRAGPRQRRRYAGRWGAGTGNRVATDRERACPGAAVARTSRPNGPRARRPQPPGTEGRPGVWRADAASQQRAIRAGQWRVGVESRAAAPTICT